MNRLKENPSTLFIMLGIGLCLLLSIIFISKTIKDSNNYIPPTPLSELVLMEDDLAGGILLKDGASRECGKYLTLQSLQNEADQTSVECYQVRFRTSDKSITVMNAIWIFDNPVRAEVEVSRFVELPDLDPGILHIAPVPGFLGDKSTASTADIQSGNSRLYVTNLHWSKGSAVVRLTALSYQEPVSLDALIMPAQRITARLESR